MSLYQYNVAIQNTAILCCIDAPSHPPHPTLSVKFL